MGADDITPHEEYWRKNNPFHAFIKDCFVGPVVWVRKNIVEPNQKEYYWYHRKYNRVPTADQCYDDDGLCKWEATMQMKRDQKVDANILDLLRERYDECVFYEGPEYQRKCLQYLDAFDDAATNYFTKYGDLPFCVTAEDVFFKQKHRLMWQRRHGEIGTGMKDKNGNPLPLDSYPELPKHKSL